MKIHAVVRFDRFDERIAALLAQFARPIPRPQTDHPGIIVPDRTRFLMGHSHSSPEISPDSILLFRCTGLFSVSRSVFLNAASVPSQPCAPNLPPWRRRLEAPPE
jgi:hypothetical protein